MVESGGGASPAGAPARGGADAGAEMAFDSAAGISLEPAEPERVPTGGGGFSAEASDGSAGSGSDTESLGVWHEERERTLIGHNHKPVRRFRRGRWKNVP